MKLTRASTYALHAVAYMAQQKNDRPIASHKIAQDRGIPERFLLKVLKPLVSHRILTSVKGPNGGYKLARSPSDITLLEVIEAAESSRIQGQAPAPDPLTPEKRKAFPHYKPETCMPLYNKLEHVCEQVAEQMRKQLERVKLSELVKK